MASMGLLVHHEDDESSEEERMRMKWPEGGGDGQGVGGQDEARLVSKFGSQLRLSGALQRQTSYALTTIQVIQRYCSDSLFASMLR